MQHTHSVPPHIAIIMDGNGRWAQQHHMPRNVGHAKGAAVVKGLVEECIKQGVQCLTLFAFSTANWQRPSEEVSTLMGLFVQYLEKEMKGLADAGVRLRVIGDVQGFSQDLQKRIKAAEAATENNKLMTLCVAANYGGRWDILNALKAWQKNHPTQDAGALTEQSLAPYLSTAELPDVDLLIRTGGEQRISNFLIWQTTYSELYFTDVLCPDFDGKELIHAMVWYSQRIRRFGKTSEQVLDESLNGRAA